MYSCTSISKVTLALIFVATVQKLLNKRTVSMNTTFPFPPPKSVGSWAVTHNVWHSCVLPVRNSPNTSVIDIDSIPPPNTKGSTRGSILGDIRIQSGEVFSKYGRTFKGVTVSISHVQDSSNTYVIGIAPLRPKTNTRFTQKKRWHDRGWPSICWGRETGGGGLILWPCELHRRDTYAWVELWVHYNIFGATYSVLRSEAHRLLNLKPEICIC